MQKLTEERRMIQEAARQFTMERVLPIANKLDPEKGQIPRELIDEMAELGYFGILIPEEYGGLGLGAYEYCLVAEQLSRGWMSVGSLIARGNGLIGALKGLSPERKPNTCRAWRAASSSARSRCPSPTPARMWRTSPAAPCATAMTGSSQATSTGARLPTRPISS